MRPEILPQSRPSVQSVARAHGTGAPAWTPRAAPAMMQRTMEDKRQAAPTLPPDRVLTLVRAALVLAVLVFIPGLLEQFETAKALVVRVSGVALLGALAARLPVTRARGLGAMDVTVLAWLAVEAAATALSVSPRVSLLGDIEQHEGLLTSLGLAGLYFGSRAAHAAPAQVTRTLGLWLAAVAVGSLYALLQALHVDPYLWNRTSGYGAGLTRPFGTLGHPNMLGAAGAAALAVVATLPLKPGRAWLRPALGDAVRARDRAHALARRLVGRAAGAGVRDVAGVEAGRLCVRARALAHARGAAHGRGAARVGAVVGAAARSAFRVRAGRHEPARRDLAQRVGRLARTSLARPGP
jgi:hypothetical protein